MSPQLFSFRHGQRPRSISVPSDKALMTVPSASGSDNAGSPFERRRELRPSVAYTGRQTPTKPALASTNQHPGIRRERCGMAPPERSRPPTERRPRVSQHSILQSRALREPLARTSQPPRHSSTTFVAAFPNAQSGRVRGVDRRATDSMKSGLLALHASDAVDRTNRKVC